MILDEMCELSSVYSYVAVCMFCALRSVIIISFCFLFCIYSTYGFFLILFMFVYSFVYSVFFYCFVYCSVFSILFSILCILPILLFGFLLCVFCAV